MTAASPRRRRSKIDGKLRYPCGNCGRDLALDEDWDADDIEEGERDDICWGANCTLSREETHAA